MSAPDTREDTELVKLVLAGDTELYAVLVNRYRTRVSRYVERFTHDIEDARDVTQDVFIKVYGALDSFDPRFKFSTWLFRIAGDAAIDQLRGRRVRLLPLARPPPARAPSRRKWRGARRGSPRDAPEPPRGAHPPAASRGPLGGHRPSARRLPPAHQPSPLRRDGLPRDRRDQRHAP